jgi:hypothetical protein
MSSAAISAVTIGRASVRHCRKFIDRRRLTPIAPGPHPMGAF